MRQNLGGKILQKWLSGILKLKCKCPLALDRLNCKFPAKMVEGFIFKVILYNSKPYDQLLQNASQMIHNLLKKHFKLLHPIRIIPFEN